jgi:GNAT superfamily N-acetyltransferase
MEDIRLRDEDDALTARRTVNDDLAAPEILPYRPGDEAAIIECMHACFGVAPRLERWRHLYRQNPAGEPIIMTARSAGRVVSHLALLVRRVRAFGVDDLAGHSIDTMTHPDWQRRGLMAALAAECMQRARARGFLVSYGVSNTQSLHGIVKYEQRTALGPFPVLVRPLRPVSAGVVLAARWFDAHTGTATQHPPDEVIECAAAGPVPDPDARGGALSAVDGWRAPRFDARHSALFDDVEGLPPITMIRDAAHLAWRYPATEHSPYRQRDVTRGDALVATAVVRTAMLAGLKLVFVMEWHWRTGAADAGRNLMRDIIALGRASGAHGVAVLAARGTPHRAIATRLAFVPIPEAFFPQMSRLAVRPERADGDLLKWLEPANWYYTWGDGLLL